MLRVVNLIIFSLSLVFPLCGVRLVSAEVSQNGLIISEVKVRTDTTNLLDYDEYIELYNSSDLPIDLADYNLEYYNATNPAVSQQPVQKPLFSYLLDANSSLVLAKQPIQIAHAKQSPFSSLSDSGGRLRLVSTEGNVVDEIAWTNTQSLATVVGVFPVIVYQCNSSTVLCNSNRTQSLTRAQNPDGTFMQSNPTWSLASPSPLSSELLSYPVQDPGLETDIPPPDETPQETPELQVTCEGMIISELFPNPAGSDSGKEFIELYNPTDEVIGLGGCSLQTSTSTKKFSLPDIQINPGVYTVFSDSVTGLVLPNISGGTAWLLSPTDELTSISYAGGIDDNVSWSLINGTWEATYSATPGSQNISQPIKPCPEGQVRNPDTNRCQAPIITAASIMAPCKTGQERNPDTNRCRTIASTISALIPCKEGQERNPETNRCRTIQSEESVPCAQGQDRNPDTNRCRKVAGSSGETLAAVKDVHVATTGSRPKLWLAAIAALLALGYAAFEWRKDISQTITRAIHKHK